MPGLGLDINIDVTVFVYFSTVLYAAQTSTVEVQLFSLLHVPNPLFSFTVAHNFLLFFALAPLMNLKASWLSPNLQTLCRIADVAKPSCCICRCS